MVVRTPARPARSHQFTPLPWPRDADTSVDHQSLVTSDGLGFPFDSFETCQQRAYESKAYPTVSRIFFLSFVFFPF
jgi:hypothetical protein